MLDPEMNRRKLTNNPHYPAMVDRPRCSQRRRRPGLGAALTAVREFADMLGPDHREHDWQRPFAENNWILGTDFV
jgi:hypothetical protein